MNRPSLLLTAAVLLVSSGPLWCQAVGEEPASADEAPAAVQPAPPEPAPAPAPRKRRRKAAEAEAAPAEGAPEAAPAGSDKASLEAYLKQRRGAVNAAFKSRAEFIVKENEVWMNFWSRLKEDRNQFELRVARQRLDLFDSLASLDPKDHNPTIADFEKMQGSLIRSFENQQKEKTSQFFAEREARFKEFAQQQEKDRIAFMQEAEEAWKGQKASLRAGLESASEGPGRRR